MKDDVGNCLGYIMRVANVFIEDFFDFILSVW